MMGSSAGNNWISANSREKHSFIITRKTTESRFVIPDWSSPSWRNTSPTRTDRTIVSKNRAIVSEGSLMMMCIFLERSVLNCVHHDVGHWHTNIVFQKRYRRLWCSNSSISLICCWMHSPSRNSSIMWTSSLFDWLIQLSLFLIKTLRYHLNCSHSRWTCWIRFIFASSSNSLSIAIAWIAKSPSNLTSISYQPCCNKQDKASRSTRNSFEHLLAARNKRLRHLRDT